MKNNLRYLILSLTTFLLISNINAQSLVKINEVFSRGVPGNLDWIEVYNSSTSSIDISGYKIYDIGARGGTKSKKLFPNGTILSAKGFSYILTDTATFIGDTSGFGISNNGETVWLENAAGLLIDTVAIPALGNDTSYARVPDGSNNFVKKSPVTKGTTNGTGTSVHPEQLAASVYTLHQNYPNPFNPSTMINYQLPMNNLVTLIVFDIVGREVAALVNERQEAGTYQQSFNAQGLSSGLYYYQLRAGDFSEVKKMIVLK